MQPGVDKLRRLGRTLVGIHLRRGDYGRLLYYRTPIDWYLSCLHDLWPTLDDPVLFMATQNAGLAGEFSQYAPVLSEDLGIVFGGPPPGYQDLPDNIRRKHRSLDFFPDWHYLSQCDILLAPNSTFSFTAGMVSATLKRFFRSCAPQGRMVELDLWDTTPLEYELAEDYRHVPGLCLGHNPPYWYRCPTCGGERKIQNKRCHTCNGVGSVPEPPDQWKSRQAILEG